MTQARTDAITDRLLRWLNRYQPRKDLRGEGKEQALQDETNALLRVVLKAAPAYGYEGWLEDALDRVDLTMATSAWPTTGQLAAALEAPPERSAAPERPQERVHPVASLIAQGVLPNEREARFRGYELTEAMLQRAKTQRPCREEWDQHVRVMARFKRFEGMSLGQVEQVCAEEISADQLPAHLAHLGRADPPAPAFPSQGFRRMSDAPAPTPSGAEEIASRPYTDEERARMQSRRGVPEERLPERDEAAEAELYDGDPDAWRTGLDRHSASPDGAAA